MNVNKSRLNRELRALGLRFGFKYTGTRPGGDPWMPGTRHYKCRIWRECPTCKATGDGGGIGGTTQRAPCPKCEGAGKLGYTFYYSMGPACSGDPNLVECLAALVLDAQAYVGARGLDDFLNEFGYLDNANKAVEGFRRGHRAWKGCKRTHENLNWMLGQDFDKVAKLLEEV